MTLSCPSFGVPCHPAYSANEQVGLEGLDNPAPGCGQLGPGYQSKGQLLLDRKRVSTMSTVFFAMRLQAQKRTIEPSARAASISSSGLSAN